MGEQIQLVTTKYVDSLYNFCESSMQECKTFVAAAKNQDGEYTSFSYEDKVSIRNKLNSAILLGKYNGKNIPNGNIGDLIIDREKKGDSVVYVDSIKDDLPKRSGAIDGLISMGLSTLAIFISIPLVYFSLGGRSLNPLKKSAIPILSGTGLLSLGLVMEHDEALKPIIQEKLKQHNAVISVVK